ncbi:hypothetical protein CDL15_Pgr002260 [Punica granatum]|uniref:Uncharacterized protein n=1 Tax=Punica granatum TaxID=22663 RepID=A0A218XBT6_PUNGR|nr:hypothetical protein CDL15_Pgr002260 [Punica granatum]PKI39341.1 hypothetical protein CRG98_040207 [Punica granatum]
MAFTWPGTATVGGCWTATEAEKVTVIDKVLARLFAIGRDWERRDATGRDCSRRDATGRDCSGLDSTKKCKTGHGCSESVLVA